jgi:ubiquinone/menaquinone biosynthesis C-methylase UbiE
MDPGQLPFEQKAKTFYDEFATRYDADRYQTPRQLRIDHQAKSAVLDLLADRAIPDLRVLDCGCGTGRFSKLFSDLGAEVVGVDTSPRMLAIAQSKVPTGTFQIADVLNLPFRSEFDLVISSQVLTHLHRYREPLEAMRAALRPHGTIIIDIRNRLNPRNRLHLAKSWMIKRAGRNLAYDPDFTTLRHVERICGDLRLGIIDHRGVGWIWSRQAVRGSLAMLAPTVTLKIRAIPYS